LYSIQNLCPRVILLDSGQISMDGSSTSVIDKYLNLGRRPGGEVCWPSPEAAPGDERVRVRAVRVVSEGGATDVVDISKEFRIEIDYWNLEPNSRRLVSVHLYNSMGICVLASSNLPSVCLAPDPWYSRAYPRGLFRTSCSVPGNLLNDGVHNVTLYINGRTASDTIINIKDILSFALEDTGIMRKEYTGKWIGAVRPRLDWQTIQLS